MKLFNIICLGVLLGAASSVFAADWPMFNSDAAGTRTNSTDGAPSAKDVKSKGLEIKWKYETPGAVHATPIVVDGVVYAGDSEGNFYALNAKTGAELWRYTGLNSISASALVAGNRIIIGDLGNRNIPANDRAADDAGKVYAFYKNTENGHQPGELAYVIQSSAFGGHPMLAFYGSATLAKAASNGKDLALIGLSSVEENATLDPNYQCCSFRGGVAAFNPNTGAIAWLTYLVPLNQGSSGASVWSTPTYDQNAKRLYVSTGNNYSEPSTHSSDAIIALNAGTGVIIWETQLTADDTWNYNFPISEEKPDSDFGDSVNIFSLSSGRKVVAAAQKSGFYHLLDANTGQIISRTQVVPFGINGGLFADSAYDKGVSYVNGIAQWCDPNTFPFECNDDLHNGFPRAGIVAALKSSDGSLQILWQTETPAEDFGAAIVSGLAVARGVVYAQSVDFFRLGRDKISALDAKTGETLASVLLGTQSVSGPSIVGERLFIGTGMFAPPVFFALPGSITSIGLKP